MEKVIEIVKIKQVIAEVPEEFQNHQIQNPGDANDIAHYFIGDDDREVLLVLVLNVKNKVIAVHRAHVGQLDASFANCREIFKSAILNNGRSIIIAHQHPSNDPQYSQADIEVTERVYEAGKILDIPLLDSIITTPSKTFMSLKERGYIN